MIEVMIIVRDTATRISEQHITALDVDAADLYDDEPGDTVENWAELTREARTAVTAATRRLVNKAHLHDGRHITFSDSTTGKA